jgi:hypothetical protein
MRKTRSRKRTNKKRVYKRHTHRVRSVRRLRSTKRGGSITTPMVGSLEGEDHKGLGKIVIAGPMGVMSGKAYLQTMSDLDRDGAE